MKDEQPHAAPQPTHFALDPGFPSERRWIGDNPAGAIELSDAELRGALKRPRSYQVRLDLDDLVRQPERVLMR